MTRSYRIDYETYCEVRGELLLPVDGKGLDSETHRRLYESKIVYLENLRAQCFLEMNKKDSQEGFTVDDYELIVRSLRVTKQNLEDVVRYTITESLSRCRAS